jgi:lambda repressor-like predicted transcriptional regulator
MLEASPSPLSGLIAPAGLIHRFGGQDCAQHIGDTGTVLYDRAPPVPEAIAVMLGTIGWSVRQAERRSGVARDRIRRWRDGVAPPDPGFMAWLTALTYLHRRLASPLSPAVPPAGNRPCLPPAAITEALLVIGWSERMLARRMGEHRNAVRRILAGEQLLSARGSRWLDALADGHRELGRPFLQKRQELSC